MDITWAPLLTTTASDPEGFMTTLGELVVGGGVLMVPIAIASVLLVALAFERFWALRRTCIIPRNLWAEVRGDLEAGRVEAARNRVSNEDSPLARTIHAGLAHYGTDAAAVAASLDEVGMREADDLQKHLPGLQGIASVSPLLGLLGTVVGMIKSFYTIAKQSSIGNPELFAEPIGQALVTTAAGLSVAIPALVLYYTFRGRIRKLVRELDDVARGIVTLSGGSTSPKVGAGAA